MTIRRVWTVISLISRIIFLYLILIYSIGFITSPPLFGKQHLPSHLQEQRHSDYSIPGTHWIPRSATSWHYQTPPILIAGRCSTLTADRYGQTCPKPIPKKGEWYFAIVPIKKELLLFLPYFAGTTETELHFRIGCRWDDVDFYYTFPSIALHKLN